MDGFELEMTQVIHDSDESEDEDDNREVQAVLKVQLQDTPARFQTFVLKPGVNVVGRSVSCDIRIDLPAVSKQHTEIELGKSDIMIKDLGSQNGVKIGKRTLQPGVVYNLDYSKEFSVAGLKAWVLHDEQNGAGKDTDSDTCSESLLTAVEIAQDQAGAKAEPSASNTSRVACDHVEGSGNITSALGPIALGAVNKAAASSQEANACNSTTQSSGSFTLPEMPNLDCTEMGNSEDTEPCGGDEKAKSVTGATEAPATTGEGSNTVVDNERDALQCAPIHRFPDSTKEGKASDASPLDGANPTVEPYSDDTECSEVPCSRQDVVAGVEVGEADPLSAPTQGFDDTDALVVTSAEGPLKSAAQPTVDDTKYKEAHFSANDDVTEAADEDRLNAPTQGFPDNSASLLDVADEEIRLNAPTQPIDSVCFKVPHSSHNKVASAEVDEMDQLNAPTQGFGDDYEVASTEVDDLDRLSAPSDDNEVTNAVVSELDRLSAPTQGFGGDNEAATAEVDDMDRLNAPTQGFGDDVAEDMNAAISTACTSLDEQERLNTVTQPIDSHCDEANNEDCLHSPSLLGGRSRRLLSGPSDLSFVLCEASQPCQDNGEDEDEICPATQKDISPPLKVHALLKHGKEKRKVQVEDDDNNSETPPLSPKTTVDETPPPSPGFVPESDPEDNNASMVTARCSLPALNMTDLTIYEECTTPASDIGSPVIGLFGRVSAKKRRSGMSLRKKLPCDIDLELDTGEEHQQESVLSKASRKLDYTEQAQTADGGSNTVENKDICALTRLEKDVQEVSKPLADNAGCSIPSTVKGKFAASIDPSEKDDDAPYLHMSEIEGLEGSATEEASSSGPCRHSATFSGTKNAAEGHTENDKVADNSASPGSTKTLEQPCCHEKVPEKEESAEVSSGIEKLPEILPDTEKESEAASTRKGRRKQTSKTSRTRKQADESEAGDTTLEAAGPPARRSSGRQNAGLRMKSILSLEKRTSASGNFREDGLSQEVSDKQDDAVQDVSENAQDKAVKQGSKRGRKGKGAAKEEQEMASSPPLQVPSVGAGSATLETSWIERGVEESSLKSGNLPEEEAKCDRGSLASEEEEVHELMEAPSVALVGKRVEDGAEMSSSPLPECKLDFTNAAAETGFSEPFTSFSQILADCQVTEDGKTGQAEAQKQTAADTTTVRKDDAASSSVPLEQESVAERRSRPSRLAENADDGTVTRKTKEPTPKTQLTRRKTTRGSARDSSSQPAEVLVEDTLRESEEPEAVSSPARQRPTRAAKRGRLARTKATKKAAGSECEVLSTIPETEEHENGSGVDSFPAQPLQDVDVKLSEAPEASPLSREDTTISQPRSSRASRRGIKRATEAAQVGADDAAGEEQKVAIPSQLGKRGTRARIACQNRDSQNESTLDASLKSDLESTPSLSPRASLRGRRGKKVSQEPHAKDCEDIPVEPVSSQPKPKAVRGRSRRGGTDDAVAESTLADSSTDTELLDSKTSRRRGKPASSSQDKGSKTVATTGAIAAAEESCSEHHSDETVGYQSGRKGTRLPPKKRGPPVLDTSAENALESDSTDAEGKKTLSQSGRTSARLSQKQSDDDSFKVDAVKESPKASELQTKSSQRKRAASFSQESKIPEQTTTARLAKRLLKTEPTSSRTNSEPSSESTQSQSQETGGQGKKKAAKVCSKVEQNTVESELQLSPKHTSESPQAKPSRRQASKMAAPAQAPVTRKRDARRGGKQEDAPLTSAARTVETLEEASLLYSPPRGARRKRHVASMSFGKSRLESDDDDDTTGNEEQTLEEMQITLEPKSRRKAAVKESAVKQEVIEGPPTKRGKLKGNLPDVVPVEPPRGSRSQKGEGTGASSLSTAKTLKRKPKVLFTGIDSTAEEEQQVVRDLGGAVATAASACTHLVTDKFRRTVKALCCIGKGIPIVDVAWIKKCQQAKAFVDHMPYLLQDKKAEKSLKFSLSETLAKAATQGGVLHGWNIHATAHVQPSPPDMKEIVVCAGGKLAAWANEDVVHMVVFRPHSYAAVDRCIVIGHVVCVILIGLGGNIRTPIIAESVRLWSVKPQWSKENPLNIQYLDAMPTRPTTSGNNTVIVSCKDDAKACTRARNNGVPIVSVEFVLSGLLRYKVDIDTHRLG